MNSEQQTLVEQLEESIKPKLGDWVVTKQGKVTKFAGATTCVRKAFPEEVAIHRIKEMPEGYKTSAFVAFTLENGIKTYGVINCVQKTGFISVHSYRSDDSYLDVPWEDARLITENEFEVWEMWKNIPSDLEGTLKFKGESFGFDHESVWPLPSV